MSHFNIVIAVVVGFVLLQAVAIVFVVTSIGNEVREQGGLGATIGGFIKNVKEASQ